MTSSSSPITPTVLARVLDTTAIDEAVRPQDDLFRYVNGGWMATAQIPADRASTGSFTVLGDAAEAACHEILLEEAAKVTAAGTAEPTTPGAKIGALFMTFMDEERIEALGASPLADELAPVLAAASKEDLAQVIGAGITSGFTGPFGVDVEVDLNDPERYTTWFGQDGLGLPDESYYRESSHAELREDYVAHVARVLDLADLSEALGAGSQELARRILALETRIAQGHWDRVACRDVERMNNPMSWQALTASAPTFPWDAWRAGMAQAAQAAGGSLSTLLEESIVEQPDYVPHAAQVWESASLEDLRAWTAWHLVHGRTSLLSSDFVSESFSFYSQRLQGVEELRPRWKRGVGLVERTLGEALGEVYVERHFPPSHKVEMERLVADLIEAYRQSISSLTWMGSSTRERALDKLSQFTTKIGYPQTWRDYSSVQVTPGDLLASVRSVESFELVRALRKLGSPVDRSEWHMTPQTVNAYYNPTMNEITFPAAILQPPFFDPQADDAVNYAGIGAVIGHEIGHGFDDQGSTFDGTGKVSDWWTQEDREAFAQRTAALIGQYDAFQPALLVEVALQEGKDASEAAHVNGALTIGENIGDLGGLGIALKAYAIALARRGVTSFDQAPVIDGLSALERFFYSWARIWRDKSRVDRTALLLTIDPHSPDEFRCNGIVRNIDAFYETFGVVEGDGLWLAPQERVAIW